MAESFFHAHRAFWNSSDSAVLARVWIVARWMWVRSEREIEGSARSWRREEGDAGGMGSGELGMGAGGG